MEDKRSSRLMNLLGRSSLSESVGHRDDDTPISSPLSMDGHDINEGRYAMRDASMVALDRIIPDPEQPRKQFDETDLKELAASIEAHSLLQPIRIRWSDPLGKWLITAGERRYRAHQLLGRTEIAAICVEGHQTEADVRVQQLVENLQRKDLGPVEQALAYKAYMEAQDVSAAELSRRLQIPRSTISESLSLLKLTPEQQEQIDAGTLGIRDAYSLAREVRNEDPHTPAKSPQKGKANKKRKRGIELTYKASNGAKIIVTSGKKLTDQEIAQALLDVARELNDGGQPHVADAA